ncbi:MAG: ABC transporter permease subunit [Nocardioidaceae bacterium]
MTPSILTATPTYAQRPVPWHRLGWVVWRRYRTTMATVVALLGLVAVYVVIGGNRMRTAYAAAQACRPHSAANCRFAFDNFHTMYANVGVVGAMLIWIPGVIGAFAGAPLLAREFETGTFRYAWTQSVGRMRWLVAHLVAGALGVAVISAVLGVLITWYDQPLVHSGVEQRLHESEFPLTGMAVVGWALAGYAIGVLAGLVSRRVLPALAATLVVWTGLGFLAANVFRAHYQAPLVTSHLQLAASDLSVQQWWTKSDVGVSETQINQVLQSLGVQSINGGGNFQAGPGSSTIDPVQYLLQHGYTQWTSYQPDSRYWPFQWMEFGWLAVLSLVVLATTLWLVRRRSA